MNDRWIEYKEKWNTIDKWVDVGTFVLLVGYFLFIITMVLIVAF